MSKQITIREAVEQAFSQMPEKFYSLNLCASVRKILKKRKMDGTILRRLRELRNDGKCVYKVIDSGAGKYQKIQ